MSEEVKLLQPLQYLTEFLNKNIRSDGRKFDEFRSILLNCDSIGTANGSAMIRLGNSSVICGITTEIVEPNSETPDEGMIKLIVKLPELCSPKYCMTDSTNDELVLTEMLNNVIKNSKLIDYKKLCILEGKYVWNIDIEVICLNNNGNVFDLFLSSIVAALHSCGLQSVDVNDKNEISYEERKEPLELLSHPIATSFAVIDGKFLIDPSIDEESLSDSAINIVVNADDDSIILYHSSGSTAMESKDIANCYKMAKNRSKAIKKMILEGSKSNSKD